MSKASVDPAELRRFAQDLKRFNTDLEGLVMGLKGKLSSLSGTWRDQEEKKFTETFDQTVKSLGKFLEESHTHVLFLGKKAASIEEYLKVR